jgi:hypothetical protein
VKVFAFGTSSERDLEFGMSDQCGDDEGVGEWERRKLGMLFIFALR